MPHTEVMALWRDTMGMCMVFKLDRCHPDIRRSIPDHFEHGLFIYDNNSNSHNPLVSLLGVWPGHAHEMQSEFYAIKGNSRDRVLFSGGLLSVSD